MLPFETWRDLAVAFVQAKAISAGWLCEVCVARTGSAYVRLRRGADRACVRLSHHRVNRRGGDRRLLDVVQQSTGRLRHLDSFLRVPDWSAACGSR